METAQEKQQSEIIALKSIYADDFIELQPRAWKVRFPSPRVQHLLSYLFQGAAHLHEFKIKITHLDQPAKVFFHLHTM
jgi:translation initiation factor 2-alpha kinase 4